MSDTLSKLYYDPSTGFIGVNALYKRAKELDKTITLRQVRDWYREQALAQQFSSQSKKYPLFKIASRNPNSWQIDLMFWKSQPIIVGININSRIGFAKLIPNKKAETIEKSLMLFIKLHGINSIVSDNGSEWMNNRIQKLLKDNHISHYAGEVGDHNILGKIDRWIRTIKMRLSKINPKRLTQKLLNEVIENYNTTYHSAIKATPNSMRGQVMFNEVEHNEQLGNQIEKEIPKGSMVRYKLKSKVFDKEGQKYSNAVYKVIGLDGLRMHIQSKNGHVLYKPVNELKLVQATQTEAIDDTTGIHEVERILDHEKLKNGKYRYLVQWADGSTTWEPQRNLRVFNKSIPSQLEKSYFSNIQAK